MNWWVGRGATVRSERDVELKIPTMPLVRLRGPLKQRAGDEAEHHVDGATVREILRALEGEHPALAGWILDERGTIRRHINVFVAGERGREDTKVGGGDTVEVLPAISGGCT